MTKNNDSAATIGKLVDDAMLAIERDNPSLKGVLPKDYAHPRLDKQRLGQLIDLVGDETNRSRDVLGRVYEYFLSQFASAEGKKGGQFYTPRCVVQVLVAMLQPYKGRVYDPCCGAPRGAVKIIPERKGGKPVGSAVYLNAAEAYPAGGGPQARTRLKPGEHAARGGTPSRPQGCKPKPEHGYARNLCQKRPEGQHPGNRWRWGGSHRVAA